MPEEMVYLRTIKREKAEMAALRADLEAVAVAAQNYGQANSWSYAGGEEWECSKVLQEALARPGVQEILKDA